MGNIEIDKTETIDVTDTYMGIFREEGANASERKIRIGLFKKGKIYGVERSSYMSGIQSYTDIFTGDSLGLYQKEGQDIVAGQYKFGDADLISGDYSARLYDTAVEDVTMSEGRAPFNAEVIGLGLVKFEDVNRDLQGNVPLTTVVERLKNFSAVSIFEDGRLDNYRTKVQISESLSDMRYYQSNIAYNGIDFDERAVIDNTNKAEENDNYIY
jgi:hypothetical protein